MQERRQVLSQEREKLTPQGRTPESYLSQSLAEFQAGKYQDSIASARAALKIRPEFAEAYNNIAVSEIRLQNFEKAVAAAETAVRLKPDLQLAKNNLAWAISEKQKADAAKGITPRR